MRHRKPHNNLRALRNRHPRISQRDLALKIAMSVDRFWRIENGYETPTVREVGKLAKALRVAQADLGFALPQTTEAQAS